MERAFCKNLDVMVRITLMKTLLRVGSKPRSISVFAPVKRNL